MKKLIFLAIVLLSLVGTAFAAERSDYFGTWVLSDTTSNGDVVCEVFVLTPGGNVYYLNEYFNPSEPSFGRQYVNIWRQTEDGIHIIYGDSAETYGHLENGFLIIGGVPYGKVPTWSEPSASCFDDKISETSLTIILPPGEYNVGQDLPAGIYNVQATTPDKPISFITWDADHHLVYSNGIGNNETLFSAVIGENHTVNIYNGYAILTPAEIQP